MTKVSIKKMKVLLILPLYLTLFLMCWRFRHVIKTMADVVNIIKAMADVEDILNDDDFFGDTAATPKEGTEQHRKPECLKSVIGRDKDYLLGGKWAKEKVGKASDETINKTYVEYKQREQNEKGEKLETS